MGGLLKRFFGPQEPFVRIDIKQSLPNGRETLDKEEEWTIKAYKDLAGRYKQEELTKKSEEYKSQGFSPFLSKELARFAIYIAWTESYPNGHPFERNYKDPADYIYEEFYQNSDLKELPTEQIFLNAVKKFFDLLKTLYYGDDGIENKKASGEDIHMEQFPYGDEKYPLMLSDYTVFRIHQKEKERRKLEYYGRFYLNCHPECLITCTEYLIDQLIQRGIPCEIKIANLHLYDEVKRADKLVLYFHDNDLEKVYRILENLHQQHPEWLCAGRPVFTMPINDSKGTIMPGISFVESRGSFGQKISQVLYVLKYHAYYGKDSKWPRVQESFCQQETLLGKFEVLCGWMRLNSQYPAFAQSSARFAEAFSELSKKYGVEIIDDIHRIYEFCKREKEEAEEGEEN